MRGRKPTPTHRRELEGNPGRRPLNTAEPQLPVTVGQFEAMPESLVAALQATGGDEARATWLRVAPMLARARQVTDADRDVLIAVCLEWGRYLAATKHATSMLIMTPSGYAIPNPYASVAARALAQCARLWAELGMTPSSRSRVQAQGELPNDPFAEFDQVGSAAEHSH